MESRHGLKPWLRNKPLWFIKLVGFLIIGSLLTWAVLITFIISAFEEESFIDIYKDLYLELKETLRWKE